MIDGRILQVSFYPLVEDGIAFHPIFGAHAAVGGAGHLVGVLAVVAVLLFGVVVVVVLLLVGDVAAHAVVRGQRAGVPVGGALGGQGAAPVVVVGVAADLVVGAGGVVDDVTAVVVDHASSRLDAGGRLLAAPLVPGSRAPLHLSLAVNRAVGRAGHA